jgi:hypothetical protein
VARPERFELPTLCFEDRLLTSRKQSVFNHSIENLRLSSSRRMCLVVRGCIHLHAGSLQKSLQSRAIENGAAA